MLSFYFPPLCGPHPPVFLILKMDICLKKRERSNSITTLHHRHELFIANPAELMLRILRKQLGMEQHWKQNAYFCAIIRFIITREFLDSPCVPMIAIVCSSYYVMKPHWELLNFLLQHFINFLKVLKPIFTSMTVF